MSDPSKKHITSNIFKRDNTPTTIPFLITFRAFIYITSSLSKKELSSDRRFHNSKHLPPSKNEQHIFTKEEIKDSNTYLN